MGRTTYRIDNLKTIAEELGVTTRDIADACGVQPSTVRYWLSGGGMRKPQIENIQVYIDLQNSENGLLGDKALVPVITTLNEGKPVEEETPAEDPAEEDAPAVEETTIAPAEDIKAVTEEPVVIAEKLVPIETPNIEEQIQTVAEDAAEKTLSSMQKLLKYMNADSDNPIFTRYFGKNWTLMDVMMNTDLDTIRQFITEYELGKDLKPGDAVYYKVLDRLVLFGILTNDNGDLKIYRDGEIICVKAVDVRKAEGYKLCITAVR
jgi:transcriptional regulator with XRE-family HTH domain